MLDAYLNIKLKKRLFALALPSHTHTHVTMLTFEF